MEKKEIVLACDHAGLEMKQAIREMLEGEGYTVTDVGTYTADSMDYPDLAKPLAEQVLSRSIPGIIICGTGIGVSIAANKMHGIRAALCHDEFTAQMCREHNNANVLAMGARVLSIDTAKKLTNIFLKTEFAGDRHARRVEKLMALETNQPASKGAQV